MAIELTLHSLKSRFLVKGGATDEESDGEGKEMKKESFCAHPWPFFLSQAQSTDALPSFLPSICTSYDGSLNVPQLLIRSQQPSVPVP